METERLPRELEEMMEDFFEGDWFWSKRATDQLNRIKDALETFREKHPRHRGGLTFTTKG